MFLRGPSVYKSCTGLASPQTTSIRRVLLTSSSSSYPFLPRSSASASASFPEPSNSSSNKKSSQEVLQELDALLNQAKSAAETAEKNLQEIENLPSAQEEPELERDKFRKAVVVNIFKLMATLAVVSVFLYVSCLLPLPLHALASLGCGLALGLRGLKKRSLDLSGAVAAAFVGATTLFCSFSATCVLLAFYFSSSALTKFKEEAKDIEEGHRAGGQRNWVQVLANSLVPTLLAVLSASYTGLRDLPLGPEAGAIVTMCMGGILGYYACSNGDTWASELGVLSTEQPRLITNLRPVRRGTNGGITLLGTTASVLGGLFIGVVFCLANAFSPSAAGTSLAVPQWLLIPLGLAAGLIGSLTDSLLGATLQFTGLNPKTQKITSKPGEGVVQISGLPFLTNNAVNFVSATTTAVLFAFVCKALFIGGTGAVAA